MRMSLSMQDMVYDILHLQFTKAKKFRRAQNSSSSTWSCTGTESNSAES